MKTEKEISRRLRGVTKMMNNIGKAKRHPSEAYIAAVVSQWLILQWVLDEEI